MKKLLIMGLILGAFTSQAAVINCSGDGLSVTVDSAAKMLRVSGTYNGEARNISGQAGRFVGTPEASANFRKVILNVDDENSDLNITDKNGRIRSFTLNCID